MSLTNNGTIVKLDPRVVPDAYVPVAVVENAPEYSIQNTLIVPKATVENADQAVTFDNIITDAAVGINKQISDIVTADFDTVGGTVEVFSELVSISSNVQLDDDNDFYTDSAMTYICQVTSRVETV